MPAFTALADLVAWVEATTPGAVLADGNPDAGILILGESPSAEDLRTGRPFTGPAGQLLDRMLAAIGLDRTGCYITLLCPRRRIPGPPDPQDIDRDLPLTRAHIRLAAPRAVLLLGGTPTQALTASTTPISKLRGQPLALDADGHRPSALATFNPAYLLRRPADKAHAWADLLAFRRMLAQ
jgi:DNA polymerase